MLRTIAIRLARAERAQGIATRRLEFPAAGFSTTSTSRIEDFFDGHQDQSPRPTRQSEYSQRMAQQRPPGHRWENRGGIGGAPPRRPGTGFGLSRGNNSAPQYNGERSGGAGGRSNDGFAEGSERRSEVRPPRIYGGSSADGPSTRSYGNRAPSGGFGDRPPRSYDDRANGDGVRSSRDFDNAPPRLYGNRESGYSNTPPRTYNPSSDFGNRPSRDRDVDSSYSGQGRNGSEGAFRRNDSGGPSIRRDMIREPREDYPSRPRTEPRYGGRRSDEPLLMTIKGKRSEPIEESVPFVDTDQPDQAPSSSSSTAIVRTSEAQIDPDVGELDSFFAGHVETPDLVAPATEEDGLSRRPAKTTAPAPLASYTPPTESGVAIIKDYFLEHKFLTSQQIWKMGTEHLKAPIRESQVVLPNGRIRMKRVSTMREGRRVWVPPAEASFPEHPFRSVRFLKETILASLEDAGVIHKTNINKPLETEEEHEEAIKLAESQNRKAERRAVLKGLPTPAMKAPATTKLIWGWMLGPPFQPRMTEEEKARLKEERKARNKSEWAEYKEKDKSAPTVWPVPPDWQGGEVRTDGRRNSWDQRRPTEHDLPPHLRETAIDPSEDADQASPSRLVNVAPDAWDMPERPGDRRGRRARDAEVEEAPLPEPDLSHLEGYTGQVLESSEAISTTVEEPVDHGPRNMEDLHAKTDWKIDHSKWNWCAKQEFEYHQAKILEAEATAERQFIRRTRMREEREERRRQAEEDERTGLGPELVKERRRLDSIEHIEHYAKQTGQDVSQWYDEVGGELGDIPAYAPRSQTRGGAIPRGSKNPRSKFKPFGFPIN